MKKIKRKAAFLMAAMLAIMSAFSKGKMGSAHEPEVGAEISNTMAPETEPIVKEEMAKMVEVPEIMPIDATEVNDSVLEDALELAGEPSMGEVITDEKAEILQESEPFTDEMETEQSADLEMAIDLDTDEWIEVDSSCAELIPAGASAGGIALTADFFPDSEFLNYVKRYDKDEDGSLSQSELDQVTEMDIEDMNIQSLYGIERFTKLESLTCSSNKLMTLSLNENTALKYLDCSDNQLTSLDLSKNTALTEMWCSYNKLESLDVHTNEALKTMVCDSNQLTSLNLRSNTALTSLYVDGNKLTELDVSENTALENLDCSGNQLKSLNVGHSAALETLNCSENKLTSLDMSKNADLIALVCYDNQLTSLDMSGNTALGSLRCGSNQLVSLDVSKNTALTQLSCEANQLKTLNLGENEVLYYLYCDGNQLTSLDVSQNIGLHSLSCSNNQLTSLDVSQNTALENLYCNDNQLTNLDVRNNTALEYLDCDKNQLETLDVSGKTALETLDCGYNQLTSLDVSGDTALKYLFCESNQLASLDASDSTELVSLVCASQYVTVQLSYSDSGWVLDMSKLVGSENLSRVKNIIPAINGGLIVFPLDDPPGLISYQFFTGFRDSWNDFADVMLPVVLTLEKGNQQPENDSTQSGGTSSQPGNVPVQAGTSTTHKTHTFGDYVTTKDPTVLEEGTQTRTCTVCGASESVPIAKLTPTIKLNVTSIKLKTKQSTTKVKVSGLASGDKVVSWKSSNPKIVTVNKKTGKITAKSKKGTATITVTLKSGISKKFKVTVQKDAVACTKIKLNKKSVTLKKGKKFTLKPTVTPITCVQKVTYKSSNNSVATVSKKGVIKAKKKGTATITVTVGKKKTKCKVKVK